MAMNLRSLIGRLDDTTRRALEGAAGLSMSRTHYEVEMEHWLVKLLEADRSDIPRVLRHFEIDPDRFLRDLERGLGEFKTGNGRRPDLSETIEQLACEGWVQASINFGLEKVRSATLFLAALGDSRLQRRLRDLSPEIAQINLDSLQKDLLQIVAGSSEDREVLRMGSGVEREAPSTRSAGDAATPALDQFTVDLTDEARAGRIDPVLGRDFEIRQVIDILTRKRQNNPILTGEAGVGKTAAVEGLALRIAEGDVPEPLQGVALKRLDLMLLQAGAGVKGEFENRLKQVLEEVAASAQPIILFIDEAHTMIGAGGQEGQGDAANLLKPALARGELRTVAATTWTEYKKYFEKDPALTRRFQVVPIGEPGVASAVEMMRGAAESLAAYHGVRILDEAIVESVRLSHRYIPARQLPEKCLGVLDTACARVAMAQLATPPPIEDARRRVESLSRESALLTRESATGIDHGERLAEIAEQLAETQAELQALEQRWAKERELAAVIRDLDDRLSGVAPSRDGSDEDVAEGTAEAAPLDEAQAAQMRAELEKTRAELTALQGELPLVLTRVDGQAVSAVISGWTGIPVGKMVADEIQAVLQLAETLRERIIGQDHALEAIAKRIQTARANLDNPSRPQGVFLLVGPSGVGKTETAMALADALYGGERNAIVINMSEYQEAHTVSSLKGSPPGYVGYGEGGVLTEAVRRRPYSIVLLDEVEKAHPDVMELFFQVFDKGMLEDGEGREVDFKNTIILLGSNVATAKFMALCEDPDLRPDPEALTEAIRPDLLKVFPPALLGRMVAIPYYPLSEEVIHKIIHLQLEKIVTRVRENHRAEFVYDEALLNAVAARCNDPDSGARTIDRILTHALLPQMSTYILSRMVTGESFSRVEVGVAGSGEFTFRVT